MRLALGGSVLLLLACASGGSGSSERNNAQRYLRLGQLQFEQGKTMLAIESIHKALDIDSDIVEAYNFLGLIYLSTSEFDKAIKAFKDAVRVDPYSTDSRNHLGVAYKEIGEYDRAHGEFETALKDRGFKSREKIFANLGHLYLVQGRSREAIGAFKEAVDLQPDYLLGILGLGRAYMEFGREDLAAESFRRVVKLSPDSPEAARARRLLTGQVKREGS